MIRNLIRPYRVIDLPFFAQNIRTSTQIMNNEKIVAVCQMNCLGDKMHNLNIGYKLINEAKDHKAEMVFLPEAFDYLTDPGENAQDNAESVDGFVITKYAELARKLKIWLSLGGFHEKTSSNKINNTHLIIDEEGNIRARYSKIHLFDLETAEQSLTESNYTNPGNAITPPVETPIGKVGLGICYDLRFPELSLILSNAGAEILTYPSAFTFETGAEHWETLLRARAIETQCYVIAAAQSGKHNAKRTSWGHAMIVDPWGTIIAQCSGKNSIAFAKISNERITQIRSAMPLKLHRRNDLYPKLEIEEQTVDEKIFLFDSIRVNYDVCFYKTQFSIAFTNLRCVVPGHVLIIPKQRVEKLSDLSQEEITDLFITVQKVEKVLKNVHKTNSSTVTIQNGEDAGQTVKHLHVHILPRKKGDFEDNDEVYKQLANHNLQKQRTMKEMIDEALQLKSYFNEF